MKVDVKELKKEALQRLADARKCKADVETDIRECYFFIAPDRCKDISSTVSPSQAKGDSKFELQTSIGIEVSEDFVNEVMEGFIPETAEWMDQRIPAGVDESARAEAEEDAKAQTEAILARIKETNFYSEFAKGAKADLPIGTIAIWIDNERLGEPTVARTVPLRELEINVGPDGLVDDRFVVRHTMLRHAAGLIDEKLIPETLKQKQIDSPNTPCRITWGFWRLWSETGVVWQGILLINEELVSHKVYDGLGSIPLIVTRFDPDPMFAFGFGPSRKALPEYRRADEMEALEIESYDQKVHPPFIYNDDGVINFSNGIEAGMGYAARLGPGQEPRSLTFDSNLQYQEFTKRDVEMRIKRMHYVDYPEQRGKTPPTAAQWLDEMAMRQRRLGRPGKAFWSEGPKEYFMRFRYLMQKEGIIQPILVNGKELPLSPYNPTEKAKDHQDVLTADRTLTIFNQNFPQVAQVAIDAIATMENIKAAMRDKMVVIRSSNDLNKSIEQLAPILGSGAAASPSEAPVQ